VGAFWEDDGGSNAGSAYLFDISTGRELFKLTASDPAAQDNFGVSVAISGPAAIVGAPSDDDAGGDSGSAYVFDGTTGQQLFKLTASDAAAGDQFGQSVSITGNTAIVGAWQDDDAGSLSGSAYLFDVTTGQQLFKLTASDAAAVDQFGHSVAICGAIALVGALGDDDAGEGSGSAYLFDANTGQELSKLTASDAAAGDLFGISVAISDNTAVIGANQDDDRGIDSGSAYTFEHNCAPANPADLDGDGSVGFGDLLIVLASWGDCPAPPAECPADLDGSGDVGFADLLLVLSNWSR
jgi:outer membrane protein assembly factor BamB